MERRARGQEQRAMSKEILAKSDEHPSLILPLVRGGVVGLKKVSKRQKGKSKGQRAKSTKRYAIRSMLYAFCFMLLALSSLLIVIGCGSAPKYYVRQQVDYKSIKKIAVLPFETLTSDEFAGEKIRKSAITELLSRGIDVIEPGEVTRTLVELKIRSLGSIKTTDIQNIAKTLGAEALMMGSVEAYEISKGISVSYPEVSINLRLVEASSGNTIWSVCHTSGGASFWTRHFGAEGISLSEAASKVVKEAIDTLF
jgi:TolB-like protein